MCATDGIGIAVAVIADQPDVRASLQAIVDAHPTWRFAGSAADADALADSCADDAPDVIVADIAPDAAREVLASLAEGFAPPLVLLVDDADGERVAGALGDFATAVAIALLPHDAPAQQIAAAVEAVAAGLCVLAPEWAARTPDGRSTPHPRASGLASRADDAHPPRNPPDALTSREIDVLSMLAEGLGNKDIARRLDISDNTVKFHLSSIFGKLGATSRTEAVMLGMRRGYVMV
ncbi:helix-turn-helix transcriptional regulator [Paraburkholderia humisilvae]|uniref:Transcriptional regulatory protein DegU n=2 Tax=Paraburkholderia humisilvae TaxID=627669 RepID=A0A6J5DCY0_9BURK|nr:response regulator transcription factor [Paraburkholderia humisilvae]CAB3752129.1 Transcriptional regulatory protein DegU [Paraburkholderia humisilvae]